jgi:hypothetical protein
MNRRKHLVGFHLRVIDLIKTIIRVSNLPRHARQVFKVNLDFRLVTIDLPKDFAPKLNVTSVAQEE